jgi:hypothetical protein
MDESSVSDHGTKLGDIREFSFESLGMSNLNGRVGPVKGEEVVDGIAERLAQLYRRLG